MAEFTFRQSLWQKTDDAIREFMESNGQTSTVEHNFLSTWTEQEKANLLGYKETKNPVMVQQNVTEEFLGFQQIPSEVNWVAEGKVSPVQNQGSCGSCWAFAVTSAVETAYAIKHNSQQVPKLSEQQMVSCSTQNYGCGGGWMTTAF